MSDELPAPLVPADVDLRGFPGFMLNVERLLASELVALGTLEELGAAEMLWARAWQQSPPGSLPDDDRVLAAYSKAGKRWAKVKAMALRGFIKCSDGRLYHRVLCAEVMESWGRRLEHREAEGNKYERQQRWRARLRDISARLREAGITPPKGASLEALERLLETSTPSTVVDGNVDGRDGGEIGKKETGQGRERDGTKESKDDSSDLPEFEAWYEAYPKRVGRGQAIKAYRVARKKASADTLLAAARQAARRYAGKDPEFIPHPSTWLNGERWLDEQQVPRLRAVGDPGFTPGIG